MTTDPLAAPRKCYGGLHALDCPHVRMVADAAVAALLPRIERLEKDPGLADHRHYVRTQHSWSNRAERTDF